MQNKGIDADALSGIYNEAILFVAIFSIMSIISIIISKRNAKKFEKENPLEERKAARKEEESKKQLDNADIKYNEDKTAKVLELSNMLKDGLIDEDEFKTLKKEIFA